MRETSLEDFLDGSKADQGSTAGEAPEDASEESAEHSGQTTERNERAASETESPDLAAATYAWTQDQADCTACGTAVERRWRDDGQLVCADCKTW